MIILPDTSRTDGVAHNFLSKINTSLPVLLLSRQEKIETLNEEVFSLKGKSYIIIDYIENGWNVDFPDTLIVGKNIDKFTFLEGENWKRLSDFIADNPPQLYFKRELLEKDRTETILPIEYPNWQPDFPLHTKKEFNNRPISAFNYWGRSHEGRLSLHGNIWKHASKYGYSVCDNIFQFNDFMHHEREAKKLVSLHMPHYSRIDISELMKINSMSKLSISLPGCGIKCFRSTGESIVNSICVLPEDELAYSYPFIDGKNCIKFKRPSVDGVSIEWDVMGTVEKALQLPELYDIYLESKKIADFYRLDNYIPYLEKIINKAI